MEEEKEKGYKEERGGEGDRGGRRGGGTLPPIIISCISLKFVFFHFCVFTIYISTFILTIYYPIDAHLRFHTLSLVVFVMCPIP